MTSLSIIIIIIIIFFLPSEIEDNQLYLRHSFSCGTENT